MITYLSYVMFSSLAMFLISFKLYFHSHMVTIKVDLVKCEEIEQYNIFNFGLAVNSTCHLCSDSYKKDEKIA